MKLNVDNKRSHNGDNHKTQVGQEQHNQQEQWHKQTNECEDET